MIRKLIRRTNFKIMYWGEKAYSFFHKN